WTLRQLGIWDIIYEHCSYFSPQSLAAVFERNGFEVLAVNEVFGGQFLTIEAVASGKQGSRGAEEQRRIRDSKSAIRNGLSQVTADAEAFAENYRRKRDEWQGRLAEMAAAGKKAVIWGAGSKGVTF